MEEKKSGLAKKPSTPLKRLTASELERGAQFLREAAMNFEPNSYTQRKALYEIIPALYVLRERGNSFKELAALLKDCGLNLKLSSLRVYYYEMVIERQEDCLRQWDKHLQLFPPHARQT